MVRTYQRKYTNSRNGKTLPPYLRYSEEDLNKSTDRAKTTDQEIDDFFDRYEKSIEGVSPDCLINYDETNLTDDPGNKKYIFKRGCKYPERVINSSKSSISLMFAGTADGQSLPIYVVYKADHLWDHWLEGEPKGTRYNRPKSSWFDSVCFKDWFHTVIVPYAKKKQGRKVVIGDNLSSHFSDMSNSDSDITGGFKNEESNFLDTQPIAGPSGLCNAHAFDSGSTDVSSDDQRSQYEKIIENSKKPATEECVSIKGKGKEKKSNQKLEKRQMKISDMKKKPASGANLSIKGKGKGKKSKPKIEKRQMKISDLKNLDLDPESIRLLIASIKSEKSKKKETKRKSKDSDSVSDVMSIHSDSDLIDVDFSENSFDVKGNDEGYECNKDIGDSTCTKQPTAAENIRGPDHDDKLIARSYVPVGFIKQKTYDILEHGIYKTDKNVSSSAMLCENVDLPEPEISQTRESNDSNHENVDPLQRQKCFELDLDIESNENDQNYNNTSQKHVESNQELDKHAMKSLYAVNDNVLVRYYDGEKCKYYVGFIENIKIDGRKYNYTVFFFKTIKKPQLAFRIGKKIDQDVVEHIWIVKKIVMNKNTMKAEEFLLAEKSDEMIFEIATYFTFIFQELLNSVIGNTRKMVINTSCRIISYLLLYAPLMNVKKKKQFK